MKITFKTVQNKLFTIEADEGETVGQLKEKIAQTQGFPAPNQKLIYSGKILKDDSTVGELKIKEKDFLVVMVSKPKATPGTSTPTPAAAPSGTGTPAEPAASETKPEPSESKTETAAASSEAAPAAETAAAASSESAAASSGESGMGDSFLTGSALESATNNIVEMGFPREQVVRALRASFNNPDRAVEYLMSGNIPEQAPAPAAAPAAAGAGAGAGAAAAPAAAPSTPAAAPAARSAPAPAASTGDSSADNLFAAAEAAMNRDRGMPAGAAGGAGGLGGAGAGGGLGDLASNEQIQRLRHLVQTNPGIIQPLIQQIAANHPGLAEHIAQDPSALYELLGVNPDDLGAEGGEGGEDYGGPQAVHVNLTEAEGEAIQRLEQLGFGRQEVLQAFLLCDKNEELAANFLFETAEEAEDEQMQQ